jgi:DNA-binding MarR family transcriptional regulator
MDGKEQKFIEQFHRFFNLALEKESVPRYIDSGVLLYRIEIHVIDTIGNHQGINLTGLSELLRVTKGAVSQKVKILENKKYIERYQNPGNRKEVLFKLTESGRNIFNGHKEFHKQLNLKIKNCFRNFKDSDFETISSFLKVIEEHFETL